MVIKIGTKREESEREKKEVQYSCDIYHSLLHTAYLNLQLNVHMNRKITEEGEIKRAFSVSSSLR